MMADGCAAGTSSRSRFGVGVVVLSQQKVLKLKTCQVLFQNTTFTKPSTDLDVEIKLQIPTGPIWRWEESTPASLPQWTSLCNGKGVAIVRQPNNLLEMGP